MRDGPERRIFCPKPFDRVHYRLPARDVLHGLAGAVETDLGRAGAEGGDPVAAVGHRDRKLERPGAGGGGEIALGRDRAADPPRLGAQLGAGRGLVAGLALQARHLEPSGGDGERRGRLDVGPRPLVAPVGTLEALPVGGEQPADDVRAVGPHVAALRRVDPAVVEPARERGEVRLRSGEHGAVRGVEEPPGSASRAGSPASRRSPPSRPSRCRPGILRRDHRDSSRKSPLADELLDRRRPRCGRSGVSAASRASSFSSSRVMKLQRDGAARPGGGVW